MAASATILGGIAGTRLTAAERVFFRAADPWGFILFGRNLESPDQLRRLTDALRDAVGREAVITVDQEGGRVQR
ncbi:MAG: beta-hexosaminidase, partial [Paracoccus marcusii]